MAVEQRLLRGDGQVARDAALDRDAPTGDPGVAPDLGIAREDDDAAGGAERALDLTIDGEFVGGGEDIRALLPLDGAPGWVFLRRGVRERGRGSGHESEKKNGEDRPDTPAHDCLLFNFHPAGKNYSAGSARETGWRETGRPPAPNGLQPFDPPHFWRLVRQSVQAGRVGSGDERATRKGLPNRPPSPSGRVEIWQAQRSEFRGGAAAQANSMMTASTARLSPGAALIFSIVQSNSARRMFSIFIASTTASASPIFIS